jgi:hypothetical protein
MSRNGSFVLNFIGKRNKANVNDRSLTGSRTAEDQPIINEYGYSTSIDTTALRRDQYSVYQLPKWNKLQLNEPIPREQWQKAHTIYST